MELQWPLILFTTLVAWSAGVFGTQAVLALRGEAPKAQLSCWITAAVLLAAGGIAVFFHLEHFERIFNGFGHLTSGITQELIAIVVLAVAAIAFGLWRDAREKQAENEYIELPQAAELPSAASQPEQLE